MTDTSSSKESRLEAIAPGYLARVREAVSRLGLRDEGPDRVRDAIADAEELTRLDVDVPTDTRRPVQGFIKRAAKRLTRWYLAYLASQMAALGEALVRVGETMADRLDEVERSQQSLLARVERLERHQTGPDVHGGGASD